MPAGKEVHNSKSYIHTKNDKDSWTRVIFVVQDTGISLRSMAVNKTNWFHNLLLVQFFELNRVSSFREMILDMD